MGVYATFCGVSAEDYIENVEDLLFRPYVYSKCTRTCDIARAHAI